MRWRDYETEAGARPVRDFVSSLSGDEVEQIAASMIDVANNGLAVARHLRAGVYEVRCETARRSFRVLFAQETKFILLALSAFEKRSQKTPKAEISLAEKRLASWRGRGRAGMRR